jgi:ABC-2 type transport system permease protein
LVLGFVRAGWKAAVYYPSRVIVDVVRPIVGILVMVTLIQSVAAISGKSKLMGMNVLDLSTYYAAVALISELPTFTIPWRIQEDLNSGKISITLSRPAEPSAWYFLFGLGRALPGILAITAVVIPLAAVTGKLANVPGFLLMVGVYTAFTTLYDATTGLFSAWTYHIGYLRAIAGWTFWGLFGGEIVPLHVLPRWFQQLTYFLPFRYLAYDTINTLLYGFKWKSFAIGTLWVFPIYITYNWLYIKAAERMEAFGG